MRPNQCCVRGLPSLAIGLGALLLEASSGPAWARTVRVSVGPSGMQAGRGVEGPAMLATDARQVLFTSSSRNLVPGEIGTFERDRNSGATTFVGAIWAEDATPDLQILASTGSHATAFGYPVRDVHVFDRGSSISELISVSHDASPVNSDATGPTISDDGNLVAFTSQAGNIVAGDTNGNLDVFVRNRSGATATRASVAFDGAQANGLSTYGKLSGNGGFVAFYSRATNLVPGGTNGNWHVFVRDLGGGTTELVSILPDATTVGSNYVSGGQLAITPNGRFVAFVAATANQQSYHLYVRDRLLGTTELVSQSSGGVPSNGRSHSPVISGDGQFVAFASSAANLVPGDTNDHSGSIGYDVFLRDRTAGTTTRINLSDSGMQTGPNTNSTPVAMTDDATVVAYVSDASNLVPGDTNGALDLFLADGRCGNAAIDAGEACDDGDTVEGDGCDSSCTLTACGNGMVSSGESCDDGSANGSDGCCTASCTLVDVDADGQCDVLDSCLSPGPTGGRIRAEGTWTLDADDRLKFRGYTTLPVGAPTVNPAATGIVVQYFDQLGNLIGGQIVPAGADWRTSATGLRWKWRPSTPLPGGGLSSISIAKGSGATARRVTFSLKGAGALFGSLQRPQTTAISVVLSFSGYPGDLLACAEAKLSCNQRSPGGAINCN